MTQRVGSPPVCESITSIRECKGELVIDAALGLALMQLLSLMVNEYKSCATVQGLQTSRNSPPDV
jgi:hypothetical protein